MKGSKGTLEQIISQIHVVLTAWKKQTTNTEHLPATFAVHVVDRMTGRCHWRCNVYVTKETKKIYDAAVEVVHTQQWVGESKLQTPVT